MKPDAPPSPLPLWQSPEWARALRLLGQEVEEQRIGAGRALVLTRRFGPLALRFTSRGPVFPSGMPMADLTTALRGAGPRLINAEGITTNALRRAGYARLRKGQMLALLDTAPDVETMLARARPKWRNAARQGLKRAGTPRLAPFDPARDQWLLDRDAEAQKAGQFRALPHAIIHAFAAANPGAVRVATIGHKAGLILLVHGGMATWHLGWTGEDGRALRAHHALLVHAATRLWHEGVQMVDLGLAGRSITTGIAAFKAGSGARIIETAGTWMRWRP